MADGERGVMLVLVWRFPDHIQAMASLGWRVSVACVEHDEAAHAERPDLDIDRVVVLGSAARPAPLRRLARLAAAGELASAPLPR